MDLEEAPTTLEGISCILILLDMKKDSSVSRIKSLKGGGKG